MSCTTTRILQLVVERLKWHVRSKMMTSLCVQQALDISPRAAKDAGTGKVSHFDAVRPLSLSPEMGASSHAARSKRVLKRFQML